MVRTVFNWESARIRNGIRSDTLLWVILAAPVALLLPLDAGAFFKTWLQGAGVFGWLYAFLLASRFGGDAGLLHESSVWLFQKGHSLIDYSLARLVAAATFSLLCIAHGIVWYTVGALVHSGYSWRQHAGWTLTVACVLLISLVLLFLIGAAGTRRSTDFLVVIALVSMLQDLFSTGLPRAAVHAIAAVLPPYKAAQQFANTVSTGNFADAMLAALHILAYSCVCLGTAAWLHRRWRPRLISSA